MANYALKAAKNGVRFTSLHPLKSPLSEAGVNLSVESNEKHLASLKLLDIAGGAASDCDIRVANSRSRFFVGRARDGVFAARARALAGLVHSAASARGRCARSHRDAVYRSDAALDSAAALLAG